MKVMKGLWVMEVEAGRVLKNIDSLFHLFVCQTKLDERRTVM